MAERQSALIVYNKPLINKEYLPSNMFYIG